MLRRPRAVLLDAGGVLLLPDPAAVTGALDEAGIATDSAQVAQAHYAGVRAVDRMGGDLTVGGLAPAYLPAFVRALGLSGDDGSRAADLLAELFALPATQLWTAVPPGTRDGLEALARLGMALAVVSNSDGSVQRLLADAGVCQVGPGRGVAVGAVVDSKAVGIEKPDPRIFRLALDALGVDDPADAVHLGDSLRYDVRGALGAGIRPLHVDPFGLCEAPDHEHVRDLGGVAALLGASGAGS